MNIRKTFCRPAAFVLVLALLLTSCAGGASAASMHLRKTEGTVSVADGEGSAVTPANDLGLYSGYQVQTRAKSYAWIDLDGVKLTKLDAQSQVEILQDGKNLALNVISGNLFFNITQPLDDDETFEIRTSSMMVGIRGTCGWVTEDAIALLEGTVTVTAGNQTVTVTAGEKASLTADGVLKVTTFPTASVPSFVRSEVANDEALARRVLDAAGMDLTAADPLAEYADISGEIEGEILYAESIDFEADDSPELLIISYEAGAGLSEDESVLHFYFYRNEADGPVLLHAGGYFTGGRWSTTESLVRSGEKLYVCHTAGFEDDNYQYIEEVYMGSTAQTNGDALDWNVVDTWNAHLYSYASSSQEYERGEAIRAKYTLVRDLLTNEHSTIAVFEP